MTDGCMPSVFGYSEGNDSARQGLRFAAEMADHVGHLQTDRFQLRTVNPEEPANQSVGINSVKSTGFWDSETWPEYVPGPPSI